MLEDEFPKTAVGFGQRAQALEVRPIVGQKLAHGIAITLCYRTVVALRELFIRAVDTTPIREGVDALLGTHCFGFRARFV